MNWPMVATPKKLEGTVRDGIELMYEIAEREW
jgi:hypothetical protein